MFQLALSSRWLGYLALTVAFSIVSVFFGLWQWDRREMAVEAIERVNANYDQAPVAVEQFLGPEGSFDISLEWLPVSMSGAYQEDEQVLVRTRPRGGQVGFEILVPFRTVEGASIIVNRGWVPTGEASDFPDQVPSPPQGEVTVTGRLKPPEPTLQGRGAPEGQLSSIDLVTYQELLGYPIEQGFFIALMTEQPAAETQALAPVKPVPDEGPHLSYTLQWFVFAIMAFFAYGWLLRNEFRTSQGMLPPRRSQRTDAEEEDALLRQG